MGGECQIHSARSSPRLFPGQSDGRAGALRASGLRATETAAASPPISTAGLPRNPDRYARLHWGRSGVWREAFERPRAAHSPPPASNILATTTVAAAP